MLWREARGGRQEEGDTAAGTQRIRARDGREAERDVARCESRAMEGGGK